MIINDSSNIIKFDFGGTNKEELRGIIPQDFWNIIENIVKIDGEYYFSKEVTSREMLNELIGTYLSNVIGLDVVDYKIGFHNGKIYALSKIFFKNGFTYVSPNEYFDYCCLLNDRDIEEIKRKELFCNTTLLERLNNQCLLNSIFRMTAVDLKTGQADRHAHNVIFRIKNGVVYIEKLFDFSWSYGIYHDENSAMFYANPFLVVKKNLVSLTQLSIQYPEFQKSAAILSEVPISNVLREIERTNKIKISDADHIYYEKKDKEYTKLLKKVL